MIADPGQLQNMVIRSDSGRYRLHPDPYSGGFAYVYRATDEGSIQRDVAVKVLKEPYAYNPVWRDRFIEEANALNRAESEYVVVVHALIEREAQTGLDFLVMQWIDGENLTNWLRHGVTVKQIFQIAINICHGIEIIHTRAGLAHGDITPNNVIIAKNNVPKIIDFGLSWDIAHDNVTIDKKNAGTLSYIAPEQLSSPDISNETADIYSLGALLYWLFTGTHYHPRLLQADIDRHEQPERFASSRKAFNFFMRLLEEHKVQPLIIPDLDRGLNTRLNDLITHMLEKKPADRPQTIVEVTRQLEAIQKDYLAHSVVIYVPQPAPPTIPEPPKPTPPALSLVVAEQDGNRLTGSRLPLHELTQDNVTYLVSDYLYCAPGNKRVLGVITSSANEVIEAVECEVDSTSFRFYCAIHNTTSKPYPLQIENGIRVQSITQIPERLLNIDIKLTQTEPIDLMFAIDRSMAPNSMQKTLDFVNDLMTKLTESSYSHRVAGCFFGEFLSHPYRYDWGINFELNHHDFGSPDSFRDYVNYTISQPVNLTNKGYCGAVELALTQATRFNWRSPDRYLIVIGSSPPHPQPEQREAYKLLDFSIDEFPGQQGWYQLAWNLINQHRIQLFNIWVPPPYQVSPAMMKYVRNVGELMNPGQEFYQLEDEYKTQQLNNTIFERVRGSTTYQLSQELFFPLSKPLYTVP